ncbi:MAG: hypothetical protein ACK4U0_17340 [Mesorhizobium sp.]
MILFLGLVGGAQLLFGIFAYGFAKSAIHEILGAVSFGSGIVALGLGQICEDIRRAASDRRDTDQRLDRMEKALENLEQIRAHIDELAGRMAARRQ